MSAGGAPEEDQLGLLALSLNHGYGLMAARANEARLLRGLHDLHSVQPSPSTGITRPPGITGFSEMAGLASQLQPFSEHPTPSTGCWATVRRTSAFAG